MPISATWQGGPVRGGPGQLGDRPVRVPGPGALTGIGYTVLTLGQLKMLQEVITLSVLFVPFAVLYMRQGLGSIFSGPRSASAARSISSSAAG